MAQEAQLDLGPARAALAASDWDAARDAFERAVAESPTTEALEGLGEAYFWLDDERTVEVRERLYHHCRGAGDRRGAARAAIALAFDHLSFRGEEAVAQGWLELAGRQLADEPLCPEHGLLAAWQADFAITAGDAATGLSHAERAVAVAREVGDTDVELLARAQLGLVRVTRGEIAEGMRLLDASAAAAVSGEITDRALAGFACCYVINACSLVRDLPRAAQWCRQLDALCTRIGFHCLQHLCRAEYAEVMVEQGDWSRAESEMLTAAEALARRRPAMAGEAVVRLGELRRRQGRYAEAAALFADTEGHPRAILGLAWLAADAGDWAEAEAGADRYLRSMPEAGLWLADGHVLLVRARTARGDLDGARAALVELEDLVVPVAQRGPLLADTRLARAHVHLAAGDAPGARRAAEDATDLYERAGAPLGAARAREALARALALAGDEEAAGREAAAAARALAHLGVQQSPPAGASAPAPLTRREVDVVRLVAEGLTNAEIASRLVLSEHTVHRHVANAMTKLGVGTRAAAVARAGALGLV